MMRYPVVNIYRMGGLLDDYMAENNAFKDKLSRMNAAAAAAEAQARAGQPVYHPPMYPSEPPAPPPPPPPPPQPSGGATYFGPRPGPMVATGSPKPPPPPDPNLIQVIVPPKPQPPPQRPSGLPLYPPNTVSTGIPPRPYEYGPPPQITDYYPPIPPAQSCPSGYTWTPSGCKKDVASEPQRPPIYHPPEPVPTVSPAATSVQTPSGPTGMINSTPSWNTAPGASRPPEGGVASVDCGPGQFWDGRQCRGSVGSIPTIPGGGGTAQATSSFGNFNPGDVGGATFANAMMGQVPLRSAPNPLGAPGLIRPIRVVGF